MSSRDDVTKLYNKSEKITKFINGLYYANAINGFILLIFSLGWFKKILILIQIVLLISYVFLRIADNSIYWYKAEKIRRRTAIENAFDIDLSEYKTVGYYNNNAFPSLIKYEENTFESIFFSMNIVESMMVMESIKSLIAIIIFIFSLALFSNSDVALAIAQTVFSSYYVVSYIEMIIYKNRLKELYEIFYREFITIGINEDKQLQYMLAETVEYEVIKAYYKVRLSSKKFHQKNKELTDKWNEIEKRIKVNISLKNQIIKV